MTDVLVGHGCVWAFEAGAVRIRYERSRKVPRLLRELGERLIPYEALADVTVTVGQKGAVVLRAVPRPGADPVVAAAAGQLGEKHDPYRLVLPRDKETLADYYATEIRGAIADPGPAPVFLVDAPPAPRSFKAWDGAASFDGQTVTFSWFWSGATTVKYETGDQRFHVSDLDGVEWHAPRPQGGALRLKVRGAAEPPKPEDDPASVVFGMLYGSTHESLPFAAAVLAAVRRQGHSSVRPGTAAALPGAPLPDGAPGPAAPATGGPPRGDASDIADRIRKLGELHSAGLISDAEFREKKAELLARL
ncbi:DUF4429 domain-containing protein [Microtetraspora fusca]|uniref:DUF4429 domain-containing protein n=1 Tax=Microtetraspora fusca TaxID=1997 RepID=A0ABW6V0H3_MICFU|nr:DUF4429 domain-containing protein [Microtetraspora fusca]